MFGGDGRIGFAFGLMVGLVFAIISLIWLSTEPPFWWAHDGVVITTKDTLAQWIMAILGLIAVGISYWAVRLLKSTLEETARVSSETAKSVIHLQKSTELQNRPWVNVSKTEVWRIGASVAALNVVLTNTGQTPARNLRIYASFAWQHSPEGEFVPVETDLPNGSAVLMRDQEHSFGLKLAIPNAPQSQVKELVLRVSIYATYQDIFQKKRRTLYSGWVYQSQLVSRPTHLTVGNKHNRCT